MLVYFSGACLVVEGKICSPRLDLQSYARLVDPRLFGCCLVVVWLLLDVVWSMFGRCLVVAWSLLDAVWSLFGRCLVVVWTLLDVVWSLFGR